MINDGTTRVLATSVLTQYYCCSVIGLHCYGVFPTDIFKLDERALSSYFGKRNLCLLLCSVARKRFENI